MSNLSDKAIEIAVGQIGTKEDPIGSNKGPQVDQYLKSVGLDGGYSWCMAFVYWCFNEAAKTAAPIGATPLYQTAGVLDAWIHRTKNQEHTPQAGDIFIMDLGHGNGHTGIVEKINTDGTLGTIEGNTNDNGSREGYEVIRRVRKNTKPIIGYLRF